MPTRPAYKKQIEECTQTHKKSLQETLPLTGQRMHGCEGAISLLTDIVAESAMPPLPPVHGNPAVVGLAGFGLTTMVLQFHNLGWMDSIGPLICLALIFGGLAQLIAGMQEYNAGNNFGYSAFTTYGAFWISLGLMLIANKLDFYPSFHRDVGWFLVAFTIYTVIMFIASTSINLALCIVFFLLLLGFILLDIEHFTDIHALKIAAGYVLLVCSLGAWYVMAHAIYKDVFDRNVLPVGPAPIEVLQDMRRKRKHQLQHHAMAHEL